MLWLPPALASLVTGHCTRAWAPFGRTVAIVLPAIFSRRWPARRGFTMIELIVVIVILGILAALAIPTFRKVIDTSKDKKAQVELAALAREAWAIGATEGTAYTPENFVAAAADTGSASGAGLSAASAARLRIIPAANDSATYGEVSVGLPTNTGLARLAMMSEAGHCASVTMTGGGTTTSTILSTSARCRADGDDGSGNTFVPVCVADCVGGAPPYPTTVVPVSVVIPDPWAPPSVDTIAVPNEEDPSFGPTLDTGPIAPVPGASGLGGLSSFVSTHASPPHRFMVTDVGAGSVVVVRQNSATAGDAVAKTFASGIPGARAILVGPDPTVPVKDGKLTLGPFYVGSSANSGSVVRVDPVTRAVSAPVVANLGVAPEALAGFACFVPGQASLAAEAGTCLYAAAGDVIWKLSIDSPSQVTKSVFATLPAGFAIKGLTTSASGTTPTLTVAGAGSTVTLTVAQAAGTTITAGTAVAGTTGGGGLGWVGTNSDTAHRGAWAAGSGALKRLAGGGNVALAGSKHVHYHGPANWAYALDAGALHSIALGTGATTLIWPAPTPPLVSDSFNRADSTTSLGSADTGQVWTALAGTWGIETNRAYSSPDTPLDRQVAIESGKSDVVVEVTVPVVMVGAGNSSPAVLGRVVDGSNYWLWSWEPGGPRMGLYRRVSGVYTLVGTYAISSLPNGSRIALRMIGPTIVGVLDGVDVLTVTDTTHQTATKHGLRVYQSDGQRFDNFKVAAP